MCLDWSFHPLHALEGLATEWDGLNAMASAIPFLESRFLLPLAKEFARGDEQVALCHEHGRLVAAALLQRDGIGRWSTFQPSQLPLGPWVAVVERDPVALAEGLLRQLPGLALGLGLTQLDPRLCRRPSDGPRVGTLDYVCTAWVDVEGSFDSYWEARGKNLRTNMRKQRSKLQGDGISVQFDTLCRPQDVPAALDDYGRMEAAGWKAGSGTAVHANNAQGRFYTTMMQNFCAAGRGRIWRLKFGDRVVAMDLCIESGDTLVILKTAFDPEYRAVSPAFLLKQEAFGQLFGEGRLRRIEFYGRLMEWHTRWSEQSRTLYHVNLYRWAWVAKLRAGLRNKPGGATDAAANAGGNASEAMPAR